MARAAWRKRRATETRSARCSRSQEHSKAPTAPPCCETPTLPITFRKPLRLPASPAPASRRLSKRFERARWLPSCPRSVASSRGQDRGNGLEDDDGVPAKRPVLHIRPIERHAPIVGGIV